MFPHSRGGCFSKRRLGIEVVYHLHGETVWFTVWANGTEKPRTGIPMRFDVTYSSVCNLSVHRKEIGDVHTQASAWKLSKKSISLLPSDSRAQFCKRFGDQTKNLLVGWVQKRVLIEVNISHFNTRPVLIFILFHSIFFSSLKQLLYTMVMQYKRKDTNKKNCSTKIKRKDTQISTYVDCEFECVARTCAHSRLISLIENNFARRSAIMIQVSSPIGHLSQ